MLSDRLEAAQHPNLQLALDELVAEAHERTMPGANTNPLLFELLNDVDGLAEDADVIFVLTTNRIELLEPALAMRPGRIDQAVEIKLPDAECRRRLLELYLRDVPGEVPDSALERIVAATSGVSAAFMRELVRRAVLLAADESTDESASGGDFAVGDRHLLTALADLDAASAPLRRLLGAGTGA